MSRNGLFHAVLFGLISRYKIPEGNRPAGVMMTLIFALLTLALCFGYLGRARIALLCLLATLAFSIGLFLFEIYNPEYGFRMPWIQVQAPENLPVTQGEG